MSRETLKSLSEEELALLFYILSKEWKFSEGISINAILSFKGGYISHIFKLYESELTDEGKNILTCLREKIKV